MEQTERIRVLLDRVVEAERERDRAIEGVVTLEERLAAYLRVPEGRVPSYLAQTERADQAERLLSELSAWLESNPSVADLLPEGFAIRLRAQLTVGKASTLAAGMVGTATILGKTVPVVPGKMFTAPGGYSATGLSKIDVR